MAYAPAKKRAAHNVHPGYPHMAVTAGVQAILPVLEEALYRQAQHLAQLNQPVLMVLNYTTANV